jgi:integrase
VLTLQQARIKCRQALNQIANGEDIFDNKSQLRLVPTFASFVEDHYLPYIKSYKRSWNTDVSMLKVHLLKRFGKMYMDEITLNHIIKMHYERKASGGAPGSANRLLVLMRYIFNLAIKWNTPGIKSNPTKGIPLMEENNKRERYLSVDEAQRLYNAVCQSDVHMLQYIVPMLILTGARKREVLDAKWNDFDLGRRLWRIPTTKSGKARFVPLSDGAIGLLQTVPRLEGVDYVFPHPKKGVPYASIFYAWNKARTLAGLTDLRLHDLRHSHASFLVNAGRTLYEVQHILGHSQVSTTQRYAHLSPDTLLAATNSVHKALGNMFVPRIGSVIDTKEE